MKNMSLFYTYSDSPVGRLLLAGDQTSLHFISFPGGHKAFEPQPTWTLSDSHFDAVKDQLSSYFSGSLEVFDLPLTLHGTDFQKRVWGLLKQIPFGATRTYGGLAEKLGTPKAGRAVGAANGSNPIPIIIPCHRVIGSTGRLTGFGGGGGNETLFAGPGKSQQGSFQQRRTLDLRFSAQWQGLRLRQSRSLIDCCIAVFSESFFQRPGLIQKRCFPCANLKTHDVHLPNASYNILHPITEPSGFVPTGPHLINFGQDTSPTPIEHRRNNGDLSKVNNLNTNPMISGGISQASCSWEPVNCFIARCQCHALVKRSIISEDGVSFQCPPLCFKYGK